MLIPQLTPDATVDRSVGVPPPHFLPLRGTPADVRWRPSNYERKTGQTVAQNSGLRYEEKVQRFLSESLRTLYHAAPFLHFRDGHDRRTCVPDGLHFDISGRTTIFEIKSQHMPDAWWQLRKLYEPVVQQLRFTNVVSCVEVTKSFDPSMGFPEEVTVFHDLWTLMAAPSAPFKVLIWRPR